MLFGLKTRWAAIALFGFCLLTALFFHLGADQAIQFNKNIAMAGGFLALAILGARPMVARRLARPLRLEGGVASPCGGRASGPIENLSPRALLLKAPECRASTSSRPTASRPPRPKRRTSRSSRRSPPAPERSRVSPSSRSPFRPTSRRSSTSPEGAKARLPEPPRKPNPREAAIVRGLADSFALAPRLPQ